MIRSPKEMTEQFAASAIQKSQMPLCRFGIMAVLGGVFIAFGGLLTCIVAGGSPELVADNPGLVRFVSGSLFPIGLIMVSITGADLFTSDCAGVTYPSLQREIRIRAALKVLLFSYLFNFVGTQIVAYLLSSKIGIFATEPYQTYLHNLATAKCSQDFATVLLKGLGANWLVCLGMFMGYAAKDIAGKCLAIWIPVMLFVTLGYEHSIANMFFIPAAIYSGADIAWSAFILNNLIPATIGNIIGGSVFVGCVYWFLNYKR